MILMEWANHLMRDTAPLWKLEEVHPDASPIHCRLWQERGLSVLWQPFETPHLLQCLSTITHILKGSYSSGKSTLQHMQYNFMTQMYTIDEARTQAHSSECDHEHWQHLSEL